jgi:hypothetical protein
MKLRDGLAAALLAAVCLSAPAYAQNNNSNSGGSNNSNATGVIGSPYGFGTPGSTSSSGYNAATLSQAQTLQQQLAAAQNALDTCNSKPAAAPTGPRSFTRTSQAQACGCAGSGAAGCPEGERAQLEANLAKAKADAAAFLESVKNPGTNLLAAPEATAANVGPTW